MNADETKRTAYKADRISDQLWLVKRFKGYDTPPTGWEPGANDYDECQVVNSTRNAEVVIEASKAQFAAHDARFAKKSAEMTQPHPGEFPAISLDEIIMEIDDAIFDEREPGCTDSEKDPNLHINEVGTRRLRDILRKHFPMATAQLTDRELVIAGFAYRCAENGDNVQMMEHRLRQQFEAEGQ